MCVVGVWRHTPSTTLIIECISWLMNVTDNNDARWKLEINLLDSLPFSEPRAVISLKKINDFFFVIERQYVVCEV